MYTIFCPRPVRLYSTASIFVGSERDNLGDLAINEIRANLKDSNEDRYKTLAAAMQEAWDALSRNPPVSPAPAAELRRRDATLIMQAYYCALDEKAPLARMVTALLFGLGFALLAIPSVDVFWRCVILTARHL